jgi:NitT/TauT family transport system substrate-binding protein
MQINRRTAIGGLAASAAVRPAFAAPAKVTYVFPAPATLPAFIPWQLAMKRGYYATNKLDITFRVTHGGADVAKQVGVGNVDIGGSNVATVIVVRPNGVPVRNVALLGSHPLFTLVTSKAVQVKSLTDLRGKKLGVIDYQDSSYYMLLAVLAAEGINRSELTIEAVGPAGVTQLMIAKSLDGIMAVPEWAVAIEDAGLPLDYWSIEKIFPASAELAQSIVTSDDFIKRKPEIVRGFVDAVLHAVHDCMSDPASAAKDYVSFMPEHKGQQAVIERILRRYVTQVYQTTPSSALGKFDPARLKVLQEFYLKHNLISSAVPVKDLYTNEFVG